MKIMLINPQFSNRTNDIPLGLAYIAAVAQQVQCKVKIVDADASNVNITDDQIVADARDYNPDLIGITIYTDFARKAYRLIGMLRSLKIPIVVGGPHPMVLSEEPFTFGASFVVRGEGEETFVELIQYLKGERSVDEIHGLSYVSNGTVIHNPPRALIQNLDSIPLPAVELFNRKNYSGRFGPPFGSILTARGCPGRCTYCSNLVMGRKYRFRQPSFIIEEIKFLKAKYGIDKFMFVDDSFAANRKHTLSLLNQIIKEKMVIQYACVTRINLVNPELLSLMKESGCISIDYGIEHGDDSSLVRLKKGINLERINRALSWTEEAEIPYTTNYILGFPWETPETIRQTLRHAIKFYDEGLYYSLIVPYPGTELYYSYKDDWGLENWWLKRDGLTWKDITLIGWKKKYGELAFFRLDDVREALVESTSVVFHGGYLLNRKERKKILTIKSLFYWVLYVGMKLFPSSGRKLVNINRLLEDIKQWLINKDKFPNFRAYMKEFFPKKFWG
ncbi:MAG: radical SAM protein [Candidatus Aminicenantaceae bacterium]